MLYLRHHTGGLAHLARALAWQARGGRFESDILHKRLKHSLGLFLCLKTRFFLNFLNFLNSSKE